MKAKHLAPGMRFTVRPPDPESSVRVCLTNDRIMGLRFGWPDNSKYWCHMGAEVEVEVIGKNETKTVTDDRTRILTALSIALEALEDLYDEKFDTFVIDTPGHWGLDPEDDGTCSGRELIQKLRRIEGNALKRGLPGMTRLKRLEAK